VTVCEATRNNGTAPIREDQAEAMRELYLHLIETDASRIFSELAVPLKEELMLSEGAQLMEGRPQAVTVAYGNNVQTIDKELFSIGRLSSNEVMVADDDSTVSRMHLWVFSLPGGIVLVDGWSCGGTFVLDRSLPTRPVSKPGARIAMLIPHNEAVTLRIGASTLLTLNPKLCCVCLERPRALRLPCGHQAVCQQCVEQMTADGARHLSQCPICRSPIRRPGAIKVTARAAVGATYAPLRPIEA